MNEQPWAAKYFGREIAAMRLQDDGNYVEIALVGGPNLYVFDDGQRCCEARYITCDDDLPAYAGSVLMAVIAKPGPSTAPEDEYNVHDTMFVDIITSGGTATLCTHNEHNGYYGGFSLKVSTDKYSAADAAYLQVEET